MKTVLLVVLAMFCCPVSAQTAQCPKTSEGKVLIDVGTFFDKETEIIGDRVDVLGGYSLGLPLNVRWLACDYGSAAADRKWVEIQPAEKVTRCDLDVREKEGKPVEAKLICRQ